MSTATYPDLMIPVQNGTLLVKTNPQEASISFCEKLPNGKSVCVNDCGPASVALPVSYNPDVVATPIFDLLKQGLFKTKEDELTVQKFFGTYLTQAVHMNHTLWLIGKGGEGKSTLLRVLEMLLGDANYMSTRLKQTFSCPFSLASFESKLVAVEDDFEWSASASSYEPQRKAMAGYSICAEKKGTPVYMMSHYAKLLLCGNCTPPDFEVLKARFPQLCPVLVKEKEPQRVTDYDMCEKLATELSGILNWALEGLVLFLKNDR